MLRIYIKTYLKPFLKVQSDLALCTSVQSCWDRNGPPPNRVTSMKLSKMT